LLAQSDAPLHVLPTAHGEQLPPQSIADSVPFLKPSVQLGAAHTRLVQTPLAQSAPVAHPLPLAHAGHVPPPQSTPVSAPFLMPSVHDAGGGWHVPLGQ
jgi:hypothetical protein